jgi:hypothetical protein
MYIFTFNETGAIEGIIDKCVYCKILETKLINTMHMHDLEEKDVIFQPDNGPKYLSNYFKDWLLIQEFQIIWHLPQLHDLNLIEHLWNEVFEKKSTNKKDL